MAAAKQTVQYFWGHMRKYPKYIVGLAIFIPLSVLFNAFLPALVAADVINRVSHGDFTRNDLWGSFGPSLMTYAALVFLGGIVLWRISVILIWKLEMLVTRDIHQEVFEHLINQSSTFHANRFGGSLVSQTNKLAGAYIRFADSTWFDIVTMIVAYSFASFILWPRSPMYVIALWVISLIFMVTMYLFSRRVRAANAAEAEAQNKQTGYLADGMTNIMAIKSFAAEGYENQRYAAVTEASRAATTHVMRVTTRRDILSGSFTSTINVSALVIACASVVLFRADVAAVFLMLAYTGDLTQRLWEFSTQTLRNYNRAIGDSQQMLDNLALKSEVQDSTSPQDAQIKKGKIEFKDVYFSHPDAHEPLFKDLSLKIEPGKKIGLIGHSGSGKTTFTKLLLRYSDIDSGEISIDGQNIADIRQTDLRRSIAYVPQEPLLFHRSIRENIAYSTPKATNDDVLLAAQRANATEFIDKLPNGYDTLVGERGIKLSGGQRQRVAIARAMLKDAPILVLDEATSALDSESEKLIQSALWELMEGRTAIVIAHRLSTIQRMDSIVVLEDGKIVEQGTHKELLEKDGVYAGLWKHQSGGFIEE